MSNASLAPYTVQKFFDNNGLPLANGLVYTYAGGTTTPIATYTDTTASTPNTNPVVLNSRGECNINLLPNTAYKINVTDSAGNQIPGWPIDQITNAQFQSILATDSGVANAYVLTVPWPSSSYTGMSVYFIPSNTNTGASTVNVNGIGTVAIVNPGGGALGPSQIVAGTAVFIAYSGGSFILASPFGSSGAVNVGSVNLTSATPPTLGFYKYANGTIGGQGNLNLSGSITANGSAVNPWIDSAVPLIGETITTTSLAASPNLTITLPSAGTYEFETQLYWIQTAGGYTGFQIGMTYSGTVGNANSMFTLWEIFSTGVSGFTYTTPQTPSQNLTGSLTGLLLLSSGGGSTYGPNIFRGRGTFVTTTGGILTLGRAAVSGSAGTGIALIVGSRFSARPI